MKRLSKIIVALAVMTAMIFTSIPVFAAPSPRAKDISGATVYVKGITCKYDGSKHRAKDVKVVLGSVVLKAGTDYELDSPKTKSKNAGKYSLKITVTGIGKYSGEKTRTYTYTIKKASQKLAFKSKSKTVKASKSKTVYSSKIALKGVKTSAKITKLSGSKNITVKNGKFAVKKGTKKGVYKVKVKAYAKRSKNYKARTKIAVIKVVVK